MCKKKAYENCQKCQEQVAVESLLSISGTPGMCELHGPPTPPPSDAGSCHEDSCEGLEDAALPQPAQNTGLKRKSRLAQVV